MLDRNEDKKALKLFANSLVITFKYWVKSWFMNDLTDKFMDNYFNEIENIDKEV